MDVRVNTYAIGLVATHSCAGTRSADMVRCNTFGVPFHRPVISREIAWLQHNGFAIHSCNTFFVQYICARATPCPPHLA